MMDNIKMKDRIGMAAHMKKYVSSLSLIAGLLVCSLGCGKVGFAMDIQEIKTESGIKAWLVEDHSAPILSLRFSFEAGEKYDPIGKEGTADLMSMLLVDGAGDLDDAAFDKAVLNLSGAIEFNMTKDHLTGQLTTLTQNRSEMADLLKLALMKPRFDPESFTKAVDREVQALQAQEKDKYDIAYKKSAATLYPNHAYARFPTIATVKQITIEDVKAFHQKWIAQEGLLIAMSGDITAKEAEKLINQIFGDLSKTPKEPLKREIIQVDGKGQVVKVDLDIPQSYVSVTQKGVGPHDQNWFAQVIASQIMGGTFSSVLNHEIRELRGLSYGFKTGISIEDELQTFEAFGETKNESAGEVVSIFLKACRDIQATGFTEDQLSQAKTYLKGHMPVQLDSNKNVSGFLMAGMQENISADRIRQYDQNIDSVSLDQLNQYAQKLFVPESMLIVVVGKPEGLKATVADYPYTPPKTNN